MLNNESVDCIIRVGNTLFKIHLFIFIRDSPVFAGLLALPQLPGPVLEGSCDELPICLSGDKGPFRSLFKSIYAPALETQANRIPITDVQDIVAVAHLAHKYEMTTWETWAFLSEITTACTLFFYNGRLSRLANDALKTNVFPYLIKHADTNGLELAFQLTNGALLRELYISAEQIHRRAAQQMYEFCHTNELSQVWAYICNRWYTLAQWALWARASFDAIPRLKTTMVVESMWKHIKRRDLAQFNRPRLDLVAHLVLTSLLPRVKRTLEYVRGLRRIGRPQALAGGKKMLRRSGSTKVDPTSTVELPKSWRFSRPRPIPRTGRAARTDCGRGLENPEPIKNWVCQCLSFPGNRFLMCKHLIREANSLLDNKPLTDLRIFLDLR
ncbi:hypothetical protein B0H13DRAFT_2317280 [Mycena leptocephala]|nr:hypothetical protein B0H13DRAFT_2317280 [Mycena leptocephala]